MVIVRLLGHDHTFKAVWPMLSDAQERSWTAVLPVAMRKGMLHEDAAQALGLGAHGLCTSQCHTAWQFDSH